MSARVRPRPGRHVGSQCRAPDEGGDSRREQPADGAAAPDEGGDSRREQHDDGAAAPDEA